MIHKLTVVLLFGLAATFYYLGNTTGTTVFIAIGGAAELGFWWTGLHWDED